MSIDVTYYSFSSSRADRVWEEKGTEFVAEAFRTATPHDYEYELATRVQEEFAPQYEVLRTKILSRLTGGVSTYGIDENDTRAVVEFGDDIEREEYQSLFDKERRAIQAAQDAHRATEQAQRRGSAGRSEEEVLYQLQMADLECGSISTWLEEPKLEYFFLKAIATEFGLELSDDVLTRGGWMQFIVLAKEKGMAGVVRAIMEEYDLSEEETNEVLIDYIGSLKPLLKDMKETPDALFFRDYGDGGGNPAEVQALLTARAAQHREQYGAK
jgi:hypothetical protein